MNILKNGLALLVGLLLCFSVVSSASAVTFDLKLSNIPGEGLSDINDIDFISFYGYGTIFLDADTGVFTENGSASFQSYNATRSPFSLGGGQLQIEFTNLTGNYDGTVITFDPNQTISLNFIDSANTTTLLADFELGTQSDGFLLNQWGSSLAMTYFLTLSNDYFGILSGSPIQYEAILTASDFQNTTDYTIMGDVSAVPIPGALILFGSGLIGLIGLKRKRVH